MDPVNTDVLILCGGLGKRLRSVSGQMPKPMLRVGDQPFLDILIKYFAKFGFRRFILGTGYRTEAVENYYNTKNTPGRLEIIFSRERSSLGTGGAVKNAQGLIKSRAFFVLNGDSFCKFSPLAFLNFHRHTGAGISLLLARVSNGSDYGEVRLNDSSRIVSFNEKDKLAKECLINAGVYIFDRKIFRLMPQARRFSLEQDFFPKILAKGILGYRTKGFFIDIGTPARYRLAKDYFENG